MPVISKRKLESYKRAEAVAQELRRQISKNDHNPSQIADFLIHWGKVTGKVQYDIPKIPKGI